MICDLRAVATDSHAAPPPPAGTRVISKYQGAGVALTRLDVSEIHPTAVVKFFDTGHFALETHSAEIAAAIREFLGGTSL